MLSASGCDCCGFFLLIFVFFLTTVIVDFGLDFLAFFQNDLGMLGDFCQLISLDGRRRCRRFPRFFLRFCQGRLRRNALDLLRGFWRLRSVPLLGNSHLKSLRA